MPGPATEPGRAQTSVSVQRRLTETSGAGGGGRTIATPGPTVRGSGADPEAPHGEERESLAIPTIPEGPPVDAPRGDGGRGRRRRRRGGLDPVRPLRGRGPGHHDRDRFPPPALGHRLVRERADRH